MVYYLANHGVPVGYNVNKNVNILVISVAFFHSVSNPIITVSKIMLDYIIYLNLFEFIWMALNEGIAVCLFLSIFWRLFFESKLLTFTYSTTLKIYLIISFFSSFATFIHSLYMVTFWRNPPTYNAYVMFFTGWLDNTLLPVEGVSLFFISVERCLIIKIPTQYGTKTKRRLHTSNLLICIVVLIINGTFLMLEMPETSVTDCTIFVCLCERYKRFVYWVLRNTLAVLNVTIGFTFFYFLKYTKRVSETENTKKSHNLVLKTVMATILLDLVPGSVSFILPHFIPIDINSFAGPYIRLLTSLTSLYSSMIYERIIRKRANQIIATNSNSSPRTAFKP